MARVSTAMLAAVLAACLVTSAGAQGGQGRRGGGFGGRGGFGGGGLMMLRSADVQKELKMTQPQIEKLDAKQQEVFQAMQDARQGIDFQNMTDEQRQAFQKKMGDIQTKAVTDVLDTTQQKRFHQLELQQQGGNALLRNKEVAEAIKVTDDQKSKLQAIQQAAQEEMRNNRPDFSGGQPSPEEMQKFMTKMQEMQKATNEKMLAVLTPVQLAKWKELTGEPFKGQFMAPFRRPGA